MRRLIYYVATTVDGFIARPDGAWDCFLFEGEHFPDLFADFPETFPGHLRGPLGITAENQRFDTVLMGRATYEVGSSQGITSPYPHLRQLVFSTTMATSPDPAVELVRGDARARVAALKREPGKDLWLCGGGALAAALVEEIDGLILKVNPVLIGEGVPLFRGPAGTLPLVLVEHRVYPNGFARLEYHTRR